MKKNYKIILSVFFGLALLTFIFYIVPQLKLSPNNQIKIVYENLTSEDDNYTRALVSQVEPGFFEFIEEITFTYNTPKYMGTSCGAYVGGKIIINAGCPRHRIEIDFCHELLHEFIPTPDGRNHTETRHKVLHNIAKQYVCYGGEYEVPDL